MAERKKHYWNSCISETAKQLQKQRRKGWKKKKPIDVEKSYCLVEILGLRNRRNEKKKKKKKLQ
jgi:hypothetical protein